MSLAIATLNFVFAEHNSNKTLADPGRYEGYDTNTPILVSLTNRSEQKPGYYNLSPASALKLHSEAHCNPHSATQPATMSTFN